MSNFKKTLIVGMTVMTMGAVSFGAHAQRSASDTPAAAAAPASAPGKGGAEGYARPDPKRMEEHMAKRAAKLHDELKLTAAQEPAWKTFTDAMKPAHPPGPRPDHAAWKAMSAPQRMEKQLDRMKTMEGEMGSRLAALKTFYAVLTPEQQKIFNEKAGHHHPGGERGHGPRGAGPAAPGVPDNSKY